MFKLLVGALVDVVSRRALKGHAAGVTTAIAVSGQPIIDAFSSGFADGLLPHITSLGLAAGAYLGGYLVTWLTPNQNA